MARLQYLALLQIVSTLLIVVTYIIEVALYYNKLRDHEILKTRLQARYKPSALLLRRALFPFKMICYFFAYIICFCLLRKIQKENTQHPSHEYQFYGAANACNLTTLHTPSCRIPRPSRDKQAQFHSTVFPGGRPEVFRYAPPNPTIEGMR